MIVKLIDDNNDSWLQLDHKFLDHRLFPACFTATLHSKSQLMASCDDIYSCLVSTYLPLFLDMPPEIQWLLIKRKTG